MAESKTTKETTMTLDKKVKEVVKEVKRYFEDKVYKTVIPRNVKLSEAPSYGMPITIYDARSKGAKSYEKFAKELIKANENDGKGKHAK